MKKIPNQFRTDEKSSSKMSSKLQYNRQKMNLKVLASLLAILALLGLGALAFSHMRHMKPKDMRSPMVKHAVMVIHQGRANAEAKGIFACCLKHPCSYCEMHTGSCPCKKMVRMNMPVCSECKGGWMVGDGDVPGINPNKVKGLPRG